jgi:hypothetical protein
MHCSVVVGVDNENGKEAFASSLLYSLTSLITPFKLRPDMRHISQSYDQLQYLGREPDAPSVAWSELAAVDQSRKVFSAYR